MARVKISRFVCGVYESNCFVVSQNGCSVVIDPGQNCKDFLLGFDIKAVLNTHGHSDHIWDNQALKKAYDIPICIHEKDAFMLQDPLNEGFDKSQADYLLHDKSKVTFANLSFVFHHFPGHTPGSCMIELLGEDLFFSGDFIFYQGIGRSDFPYSDAKAMRKSLEKVLSYKKDFALLCGHGKDTRLSHELSFIKAASTFLARYGNNG